jgi:hypothetical protein
VLGDMHNVLSDRQQRALWWFALDACKRRHSASARRRSAFYKCTRETRDTPEIPHMYILFCPTAFRLEISQSDKDNFGHLFFTTSSYRGASGQIFVVCVSDNWIGIFKVNRRCCPEETHWCAWYLYPTSKVVDQCSRPMWPKPRGATFRVSRRPRTKRHDRERLRQPLCRESCAVIN